VTSSKTLDQVEAMYDTYSLAFLPSQKAMFPYTIGTLISTSFTFLPMFYTKPRNGLYNDQYKEPILVKHIEELVSTLYDILKSYSMF